ncbi:MAG: hypothetical protein QNJ47_18695 [Nostocaceae cyanobacterium]|nr:hypothetical protein [Nostocaceae cyanobacterium]
MVTRADVINNARRYIPPRMPSWQPRSDTHVFNPANPDHTFHSGYTTSREYGVMPYVYGGTDGFDSGTQFLVRINNGDCPGGWDRRNPLPGGIPGRTTYNWNVRPPRGLGYGFRVPQNLAGIDCSGYVLRCWGFSRRRINGVGYSTRTLPRLCVEVTRANLKPGDILNWAGRHVRLFNAPAGARVNIFESGGGGYARAYRNGDTRGRVINRNIAWDDRYTAYSPFPQLVYFEPAPGSYLLADMPQPTILARFTGSGELVVSEFSVDGVSVPYRETPTSPLQVSYTPDLDLAPGKHTVTIGVINRIVGQDFKDLFTQEFHLF